MIMNGRIDSYLDVFKNTCPQIIPTPLMKACCAGDIDLAQKLLSSGVDVNASMVDMFDNRNAFVCACHSGNFDLVKLLLKQPNIDVRQDDSSGRNGLSCACESGNLELFKFLLDNGIGSLKQKKKYGTNLLMLACYFGHLDIAKFLLEQEVFDVSYADGFGNTALMYACLGRNYDIVQLLLSYKDSDSIKYNGGNETLLMLACEGGNLEIVKLFVADDNFKPGDDQATPLMYASEGGNPDVVQLILDYRPDDLNKVDEHGNTALMFACQHKKTDVVRLLLQQSNIDVNVSSQDGVQSRSALFMSCKEGVPFEISDMLIKYKDIDINQTEQYKLTPLMVACEYGRFDIVKLLLSNQKIRKINKTDESGSTAFMYACDSGNVELVQYFLDNEKININKVDKSGDTALTHASAEILDLLLKQKDIDIKIDNRLFLSHCRNSTYCRNTDSENEKTAKAVKLLLQLPGHSFDVNQVWDAGWGFHTRTPLMFACESNNLELVKILLEQKNIDINKTAADDLGHINAFMLACYMGNTEIVKLLMQRDDLNTEQISFDDGYTALECASNREIVELLINSKKFNFRKDRHYYFEDQRTTIYFLEKNRDNINAPFLCNAFLVDCKNTPLITACSANWLEVVTYLISREDVDVNVANEHNDNAFLTAVKMGHVLCAKLLLQRADLDLERISRRGVLRLACKIPSFDIVKVLIDKNIFDINAQDKDGNTALMYACESWDVDTVSLLLAQENIDVNVSNKDGETAFTKAEKNGTVSVRKALLTHNSAA
ncbi:hypothetical protein FACS189472_01050 [Alphaproteobacteria bacterium]|nr:hypothetical protein FACS189472_01050 [Alphaproteobacteria bacterium]